MIKKTIRLADLAGPDWEEILIGADGRLYLPGWRRGFEAWELKAIFYDNQERYALRHQVAQLRRDLARREAEAEEIERREAFYKRQCRLEAGMGLMLMGLTSAA